MRMQDRESDRKDETDVTSAIGEHHRRSAGKTRRERCARFDFSAGSVRLYLCTVFITSFIVFCTSHKSLVFSVMLRVPAARNCLACNSSRVSRSRN